MGVAKYLSKETKTKIEEIASVKDLRMIGLSKTSAYILKEGKYHLSDQKMDMLISILIKTDKKDQVIFLIIKELESFIHELEKLGVLISFTWTIQSTESEFTEWLERELKERGL